MTERKVLASKTEGLIYPQIRLKMDFEKVKRTENQNRD
jgi:hypothetical protein